MIRRPPRSTQSRSSAASDVYKRQGQDVQAFELIARVANITPYRRIAPLARAVAVKPQMQLDEQRNLFDLVVAVTQSAHPFAHQFGTDDVVVMKRHRTAGLESPRFWLPDVV